MLSVATPVLPLPPAVKPLLFGAGLKKITFGESQRESLGQAELYRFELTAEW